MDIVLIEDDMDLGAALQRSLTQAGFHSIWLRRLREAGQHLATTSPDCILLDINLPDGEGFTLLDRLRKQGSPTPILVMTARDALEDRLRALNGGADDYVIKPFLVPELIARIHVLLRRARGQVSQRWQVGDIVIDTNAQTVEINQVSLSFTGREFAILLELASAAGRVVRRQALVERVWAGEEEPTSGALEFQIHALRRKLGAARIVTVRGVGYILDIQ